MLSVVSVNWPLPIRMPRALAAPRSKPSMPVYGVTRPRRRGAASRTAAPIHHSKVMLVDPKTGAPTRIRRQVDKDGTVERIAVKSGQSIPRNR